MLRLSQISVVLLTASAFIAVAQDAPVTPLSNLQQEYAAQVRQATSSCNRTIDAHKRVAIEKAESLAKAAARRGDIAAASAAWQFVLAVDLKHVAATEYFTALGTLEKTLDNLRKHPLSPQMLQLSGRWIRDFRKAPFVLSPDGTMHMVEANGQKSREWHGRWMIQGGVVYLLYQNGQYHAYEIRNGRLMTGLQQSEGHSMTKTK